MSDAPAQPPLSSGNGIPVDGLPISRATPIVQSLARRLAERLGLQPCDRDDLEQELWLLLLRVWNDNGHPMAATASVDQPSLFGNLDPAASMDAAHSTDAGASL